MKNEHSSFSVRLKIFVVRIFKIAGWTLLSVVTLLVALILIIRIPSVQHTLIQKVVSFLEERIGTNIDIGRITLAFPKKIVVEGLFLEDQSGDTLFYARELTVDTDLSGLLHREVQLNNIGLSTLRVSVTRSASDSTFNFDYIVRAFAAESTSHADTTAATPWLISIGKVVLTDNRIRYHDAYGGMMADVRVGDARVKMREFNLDRLIFDFDEISFSQTQINVEQRQGLDKSNTESPDPTERLLPVTLSFRKIDLTGMQAKYADLENGSRLTCNLGEFEAVADQVDLNAKIIHLNKIFVSSSFFSYENSEPRDSTTRDHQDTTRRVSFQLPWSLRVGDLQMTDDAFQYYDFTKPLTKDFVDFDHLWVYDFSFAAVDMAYDDNKASMDLKSLSFKEKNGFDLTSASGEVTLTEQELNLRNLLLQTPHSRIDATASAKLNPPQSLDYDYMNADFKLNIRESLISARDVLQFAPSIADSLPVKLLPSTTLHLTAEADGKPAAITVRNLELKVLDSTVLMAKGVVQGLPGWEQLALTLDLGKFHTTRSNLTKLLADSLLPSSVEVPAWLTVRGKITGGYDHLQGDIMVTSDAGNAHLAGNGSFKGAGKYEAKVSTDSLKLGAIFKNASLGKLTMTGEVKGTGMTLDSLNAGVTIKIAAVDYNGYTYKDFNLDGSVNHYLFSGSAVLEDENIDFILEGDLDYTEDIVRYKLELDLKNADFKALKLSEKPIRARGKLEVDLATADFKAVNGRIDIRKVAVFNGSALYAVDSLLYASIDQVGQSEVSIRSDLLSGDFKGTINLFQLPAVLRQHVDRYFDLGTKVTQSTTPQDFSFELILRNTDLLTEVLFPDLEPFKPGEIKGEFNSAEKILKVRIKVADVKYGSAAVDSLSLIIDSDENELSYRFALKNFTADTLQIDELALGGNVLNDSIHTAFRISEGGKAKYAIGAVTTRQEKGLRLNLKPGEMILNGSPWEVPAHNFLKLASGHLEAHDFSISKGRQKIGLTTSGGADSVVAVVFQQLELGNLTRVVGGIVPASGELNGDFKFTTTGTGSFSSTLKITDLTLLQKPWGDVSILVSHAAGKYALECLVRGNNTNLTLEGQYRANDDQPSFDIKAKLAPFNLELIEPWTFGQLKQVAGTAHGQIRISGTMKKPSILGDVNFKETEFFSTYFNNPFRLNDERISFTRAGITFPNFKITDSNGKFATLDGSIRTGDYQAFDLDLKLITKDFQVMNTSAKDNELYYGNVRVNIDARVTGTAVEPKVRITAGLSDGSEITYVVPQDRKELLEQEGIVKFVDHDASLDPFLASIQAKDTLQSSFGGMDISATVRMTGKETLNIVIDPAAGDRLSVRGSANLTFDMDPSGNMDLAGRFEIADGSYELTFYKLVKRKFEIERGGSITWSGDPLNAILDIRASNTVETSPMDLVANQLTLVDEAVARQYAQRLPFLVYLNIRGDLLSPEISFSLDMPSEKRNVLNGSVYSKLQDVNTRESDLNKQVFALLILRRFVADNPFESQTGGNLSSTTRTSVSRLLSEQLNRLSENVKGVQLTFDVKSYEDFSSGAAQGRTQAQLGVSKSLFDDRLVVKLSGNVDLEGGPANQDDVTNYIGDLALEYKMTSDGRFRVTGFRNSNYDMIDGELTETGAGLIYIKDYNTLRELFKANAKE